MGVANSEQVNVNCVGSSTFGVYPKISLEKTYNMFESDGWLINYAGYQLISELPTSGEGRGLFRSVRGGFLIAVVANGVYRINSDLAFVLIGNIDTSSDEVFIDENLSAQICIVDGQSAYIYDYLDTEMLTKQTLWQNPPTNTIPIIPGYVSYHNTFFLFASAPTSPNPQNWYVFQNTGTSTTISYVATLSIQTKSDQAIAVKRVPGRGNNVIVFGNTVAEIWVQIGAALPYTRVSSYNIDNGCVSVSTIAGSDEFICWLAQNENNSPSIIWSTGSETHRISTDGIDNVLANIKHPDESTAFFFRQNAHLFYQLTFFNEQDNLSLVYDFTAGKFYHISDENINFYPARQLVYFNEKSYFISINDSRLYQMDEQILSYNYTFDTDGGVEIPRIRICKSIRKTDSSTFRAGQFTFWIEQGVTTSLVPAAVDLSISKNGNQSFSNNVRRPLNPEGIYRNQIRWNRLGQANELTMQLRFWGLQRFVISNGVCDIY